MRGQLGNFGVHIAHVRIVEALHIVITPTKIGTTMIVLVRVEVRRAKTLFAAGYRTARRKPCRTGGICALIHDELSVVFGSPTLSVSFDYSLVHDRTKCSTPSPTPRVRAISTSFALTPLMTKMTLTNTRY
jgi:hypothetical protein